MADRFLADEEVHELKLGQSFEPGGRVAYHSMNFDFKPASIDALKPAVIDIQQGNKVTVTVPHIEGSSTKQTVYCGSKQPSQKDYALVINHDTGEIVLEKLTYKLNLKRTRAEKVKEPVNESAKLPKTENMQPVSVPVITPKVDVIPSRLQNQDVITKVTTNPADLSASSSSEAESSSSDSSDSSGESDDEKQMAPPVSFSQPTRSAVPVVGPSQVVDDLQLSDDSDSD